MPLAAGATVCTFAPAASHALVAASGTSVVVITSVGASEVSNRGPVAGTRPCASSRTRSGCCPTGSSVSRAVRLGSSAIAVPAPTITACESARSSCTSARAAAPVIQRDEPSRAAIRPSRLVAVFSITDERPSTRWTRYGATRRAAASASTPTSTAMSCSRSRAIPLPPTFRSGSCTATTTRATPASMRASAHGGVRPKCEHGSRVV